MHQDLSEEDIHRYSRHLILPGFGGRGQTRLREARVEVVGDSQAVAVACLYLVAAGVGEVEREEPEWKEAHHPFSSSFLAALNPGVVLSRGGRGRSMRLDLRGIGEPAPGIPGAGALLMGGAWGAVEVLMALLREEGGSLSPSPLPVMDWGLPPLSAEGRSPSLLLEEATAVVVGAGGLGCPAALGLALSGMGRIRLVDDDRVDLSNLQRQVLHTTADVGRPKVESVAEKLRAVNPKVTVETCSTRFVGDNARALLEGASVVVEGSDNFTTKYAVNDECVGRGIPLLMGGAVRHEAQVMAVVPGKGPCYRCVFRAPSGEAGEAACAQAGILGPVVGLAGALQAWEAVKLLTGVGRPLQGALWLFSARDRFLKTMKVGRDPSCPVCAS